MNGKECNDLYPIEDHCIAALEESRLINLFQ